MKHFFVTLCLTLFTLMGFSQNGGQYPENDNIKFDYVGKVGTNYFVKIVNKKACQVAVKTEYNHVFNEVIIAANSFYSFDLGATVMPLKAKTIQINCGSPDNGWIEFSLNGLPVKFTQYTVERLTGNEFLITFTTAETVNVSHFNIQLSKDGSNYENIGLVWPDPLQPNRKYQIKVDLQKYKVTSLNSGAPVPGFTGTSKGTTDSRQF